MWRGRQLSNSIVAKDDSFDGSIGQLQPVRDDDVVECVNDNKRKRKDWWHFGRTDRDGAQTTRLLSGFLDILQ